MSSLNELKNELVLQKSIIESKGGKVNVANTNPSPTEITAGINNLVVPNLSLATAKESDVLEGKTFYALDDSLKTGTFNGVDFNNLIDVFSEFLDNREPYDFYVPTGMKRIANYFMREITRTVTIHLNSDLEEIGSYSFMCENGNITIANLAEMEHLTSIGASALMDCAGIDLANIPSCVTKLSSQAFSNVISTSDKIVIPANVISYGSNVFTHGMTKYLCSDFDMSAFPLESTPSGLVSNIVFDCDLTFPTTLKEVGTNFNYRGSFNHITVPANITSIGMGAFGFTVLDSPETYKLKYIRFLGETPPTFGSLWLADYFLKDSFAIYVPDNSVEAYNESTKNTLKKYIKPMSEMST